MRTVGEVMNDELCDSVFIKLESFEIEFIKDSMKVYAKEAIEELIKYMDNHSMRNTGTYKKAINLINDIK